MAIDYYISWKNTLNQIEVMSNVPVNEIDEIIRKFLLYDDISLFSFLSNYISFTTGRDLTSSEKAQMDSEMSRNYNPTTSIKEFWDSPLLSHKTSFAAEFPIWFIAGYPDVILWFYNSANNKVKSSVIDRLILQTFNPKGKESNAFLRSLIDAYKQSTHNKLETHFKKGLFKF